LHDVQQVMSEKRPVTGNRAHGGDEGFPIKKPAGIISSGSFDLPDLNISGQDLTDDVQMGSVCQ
jgi:hypothetical protein